MASVNGSGVVTANGAGSVNIKARWRVTKYDPTQCDPGPYRVMSESDSQPTSDIQPLAPGCDPNGCVPFSYNYDETASVTIFPIITIGNAPITAVGTGYTSAGLAIRLTPSPSQVPVTLRLRTIGGIGQAVFTDTNSAERTITESGTFTIRGVTTSSTADNIRLEFVQNNRLIGRQYDFTVVSVALLLRTSGSLALDNAGRGFYQAILGTTNLGNFISSVTGDGHNGVEVVGVVSPINFRGQITIQRLGVAERAYNNMTLFESRDNFPDTTSLSSARDDDPAPNGIVYDFDAPGAGIAGAAPGGTTIRQRLNFIQWATLQSNSNARLSGDLLWHSAISVYKTYSTGETVFNNDVSGDNRAGTGHITPSWNLR